MYTTGCMMDRVREKEVEKDGREREKKTRAREESVGERSGVTFLIVSRPATFCFGVYAS